MIDRALEAIVIGLRFLDRESQVRIASEMVSLKQDYEQELAKPYNEIDDARLHSIRMRLDGIISIYRAAAQGSCAKDSHGKA